LFDAIGGSGKSMLTWEWTTEHATQVRADWAGRFWYSFYWQIPVDVPDLTRIVYDDRRTTLKCLI
jgi:hypothetical protein